MEFGHIESLLILAFFTLILEILIVAATIAIAERRKLLSAILSAVIEPIKLISLLIVVDNTNRLHAVIVITIVCAIGNYFTIWLFDRLKIKK